MNEKVITFSVDKKLNTEYDFYTDKSKFTLIITNLLSNAYKYTPNGWVVSWLAETTFKNSQPYLTLSVKDSGIGIPKDEIPKLFDRFASISTHSNIKTKIQSTGLGLSIVKRIVTELEWNITVESDTDKGANFIVEMPYLLSENKEKSSI
jgi:signal transduction histidine kinase